MSRVVELLRSRRGSPLAVLALVSFGFAGCSADTSRFSDNPFSNPFGSRSADVTGSVPAAHPAPVARVESQPLPQQYQTPQAQPYPQPQVSLAGGGRGLGSYQPPSRPSEHTGTVAPRSVGGKPDKDDGTAIIVGTSDTLDTLARRYKVPASAILQANGMSAPRALQPGQRLIIPRQTAQAPAMASPPETRPATGAGGAHIVASGETVMSLSRRYNMPVGQIAKANNLPLTAHLKVGDRLVIPGAAAAAPMQEKKVAAVTPAPAANEPVQKARLASAVPTDVATTEDPVAAAEATGGLPSFRWPVRGRVIAGYGAKTNGKQNDGINVAVPEGTPIKAAEDGVVAYAGNELKGYGNLVLVRHSNGYVTAYAHASELAVKRGEQIKRGQVLGKAGQTGDVASPQLHFEIRKGSSPVDPLQFLNGA